jgi:hypothetical protein
MRGKVWVLEGVERRGEGGAYRDLEFFTRGDRRFLMRCMHAWSPQH